jgi:hypothetical protein
MNGDPISLIQSRTFWSAVITMGLMAWGALGHDTTGLNADTLTNHAMTFITTFGPFIGSLATIFFRMDAKAPVSGVIKAK